MLALLKISTYFDPQFRSEFFDENEIANNSG